MKDYDAMDYLADVLVTGDPSGAIERQEAAEQRRAVGDGSKVKIGICREFTRAALASFGVEFSERDDGVLEEVILPPGWQLKATGHSMWSDMLDEKGRKRAACFYKGAFYDRNADVHLVRRYNVDIEFSGTECRIVVKDCNTVIKSFSWGHDLDHERNAMDRLQAAAWLSENYPDWDSTLAYWD